MVPDGTRSVSVFLVNHRVRGSDELREQRFIFQAGLAVHSDEPLIPRPNLEGQATDEFMNLRGIVDPHHHDREVVAKLEPGGATGCRRVRWALADGALSAIPFATAAAKSGSVVLRFQLASHQLEVRKGRRTRAPLSGENG